MTIKKFQGKTQEEATEKARQELGAGAVVMNVKEIKPKGLFNFFKGSTFEVTAAIEEKEQFLNASKPTYNLDAMYVVLEDDKLYTKDEAMKLYTNFMKKKEVK